MKHCKFFLTFLSSFLLFLSIHVAYTQTTPEQEELLQEVEEYLEQFKTANDNLGCESMFLGCVNSAGDDIEKWEICYNAYVKCVDGPERKITPRTPEHETLFHNLDQLYGEFEPVAGESITIEDYRPNPASTFAYGRLYSEEGFEGRLEIYDLSGNLVGDPIDYIIAGGEHLLSIDVSDFDNGTYLVTLIVNGTPHTQQVTVTH